MALHRDIYWVGRQWAVTGYGMQAIDQRLKGQFDIEISGYGKMALRKACTPTAGSMARISHKALSVARKRYPEPPRKTPAVPIRLN